MHCQLLGIFRKYIEEPLQHVIDGDLSQGAFHAAHLALPFY